MLKNLKKLLKPLKILPLLMVLVLFFSQQAKAQSFAYDATGIVFSFSGLTTTTVPQSGTPLAVGAKYRQDNFATIEGRSIYGIITIVSKTANANLVGFIDNTANPTRFQPSITSVGSADGVENYYEFKFEFFDSATNTPVYLKNINLTGLDLDGSSTARTEIYLLQKNEYTNIQRSTSNGLDVLNGTNSNETRVRGTTSTIAGINFENLGSFIVSYANYKSSLTVKLGNLGVPDGGARQSAMIIGAAPGSFATPVNSPNTPSAASFTDLNISKSANKDVATIGSQVNFTLTARNLGPATATGVAVLDQLPTGYNYVADTPSVGTYNNTTGIWSIGALASGATVTLTVTATINATGNFANSAGITGNETESDISNNSSRISVVPSLDSDGDTVPDLIDSDDDNDGITDVSEGYCLSRPILLKSAEFKAKGAGTTGRPTVTFDAPSTGTGKRTILLFIDVERDHTPTPFGDNRESSIYTTGATSANMPTVNYGATAMTKAGFLLNYDAISGQPATSARLSRSQYVYTLSDANISAGLQTIDLSNFLITAATNAGDEFVARVMMYDNVRSVELVNGTAYPTNGTPPIASFQPTFSVSGNMLSGSQPAGSSEQDNILLAFGGISNESGMTLSSTWTSIFNSSIVNSGGTYAGTGSITPNSSENDGTSSAIATITGVSGTQSITFTNNNSNALLGGALLFRINADACTLRNTDGTDNPDYLDSDSDNDGCPDALEGDGGFIGTQVNNGMLTGSVASNGIPLLAGSGQAVGTSNIANQSPCFIDTKNDINQTPVNTAVSGSLLTNDVSGAGVVSLLSAQYRNSAGTFVNLTTGTSTSVYSTTGTLAGTIVLSANGNYTYTPAAGFIGSVPLNYTATNAVGGSDTASLEIQVIPVANPTANDAPIALNDTGVTKTGVTLNSTVLGNDSDPDLAAILTVSTATTVNSAGANVIITPGTAINVSGVNAAGTAVATAGSLTLNAAGTYTFVPVAGFAGTVNPITYTISDGALTDTAVLSIEVKATNAPPVVFANDDARVTPKGVSTAGNVLANDASAPTVTLTAGSPVVNGTSLTLGTATLISGVGTITFAANGNYTFAPLATYVGTTLLTYTACNSSSVCAPATLYLTSLDLPGYCYKEGITTVTKNLPVKHGITALNRAGSGSTEWPTVRQGAWTVLEAKTKGFVINRTTFVDEDGLPSTPPTPPTSAIPAANYVEGMIMYDNGVNCLKVYTGAANGWQCYNTQACPDF